MKTRKRILSKALVTTVLALLLAGVSFPAHFDVYAAGDITVKTPDLKDLGTDFPGFTLELYEVGGYDGPNFVLAPEYKDSGVTLPKFVEDAEPDQEAWLDAAESLANYIKHSDAGQAAATFEGVSPGESANYHSDKNALFLVVGETVRYDNKYYTPLPMFVRTLDGAETYTLKLRIDPVVFEHSLMKTWDDNDNRDARPKAIEVGIYYGDQLIDTVTLGTDTGKWTYKWTSEESGDTYFYISEDNERKEFQPGSGDQGWGVREFTRVQEMTSSEAKAEASKLKNYSPEYTKNSSDDMESFVINNPYNEDEPQPVPPEPGEPDEPDEPDTPGDEVDSGDNNLLGLWGGIAGGACVLLIGFLLIRRKRNDVEE